MDRHVATDTGLVEKLLRGELAAVESYERAIGDLDRAPGPVADQLKAMLKDHRDAVETLERHAERTEADPDQDAGAWGAFAKVVEKAGAALGDRALLEAMKQGEVHGVSEYRTALDSDGLPPDLEREIRERLLPSQKRHVATLDQLMRQGA